MIDNVPDAVKNTYLKMKSEQGKKLELKVIGGSYYLYVAKGIWDKKKKKPVKKTVLVIAGLILIHFLMQSGIRIVRAGAVENGKILKEIGTSNREIAKGLMVYQYGNSQLVWNLAQDMYTIMEKHPYRNEIIAMAIVKAIDPVPLRLVESRYQKLYVSRKFQTDLDPDDLSNILGYVGNHFPDLYEMFRKLMEPGGLLFYDMTSVISYSKNLKLAEKGYDVLPLLFVQLYER